MRHVLSLLTTIILMAVQAVAEPDHLQARSSRDGTATVRSQMEILHEIYGVNFVYDSSLDLDIPYRGESMKVLAGRSNDRESLDTCLKSLFKDTGIVYEINRKYIVLTKADSKKKPKGYTIFIEEQKDTLDESRITAYIDRRHNATQTGLQRIDGSRFKKGFAFLGSPDLIKEIQTLSGVSGGNELLSGMYVHGGDGTDNLFLLDGVPLYQVSHLAGLISSFNTEVVDNLDFYKSGFPARYGGKTSSVVDITTKPGDMNEYRGSFNIGLLNGGLQFEGPIVKGKTSFNLAVRRSWFDVLTVPLYIIANLTLPYGESGKVQYAMTDLNASVTHLFDKDSRLSLNVYAGSDYLRYKWSDLQVKYWEGVRHIGDTGFDVNVRWGNMLTSLNWKKKFSDDLHLNTVLYYVRSNTDVGIFNDMWEVSGYNSLYIEDVDISERNYSRLHDLGAKAELDWIPSEYHHINAGVSYVGHLFRPVRDISTLTRNAEGEVLYSDEDSYSTSYNASEASVYAADEISLANWFKANIGLRYTFFRQGDFVNHSIEPRAAFRFQLGQRTALKMSYTEMNQAVHLLRAHYLDIPMTSWMPSTVYVPPMRSRQAAGGVYVDLPQNISLNVEGYYKMMDNLYEYSGTDGIYPDLKIWENEVMRGKGRSYGAEVELRWRSEKMDVAAYYTLSWTERFFEGIWHDWYPARNDNRHKFTINATRRFSDRFEMYASWNYHTGDRMTVPTQIVGGQVYYTSPYNYKMADYHRLDIGFNFRKTTKRGNESVWNLSLYNAYCRMNPMFTMLDHYRTDYKEPAKYETVFKELAVIPIIPSFNYTLRF